MIWRQLPRSGCIRFSRTCVALFVASGPLDPVCFLPLLLSAPPFHCSLLFSPFRLLRRSLFRHRPVGSLLSLWRLGLEQAPGIPVIRVFKSVFVPFYNVKMHIPKSRRTTRQPSSDSRSRSPLSIRALRSARNERIRHITINF